MSLDINYELKEYLKDEVAWFCKTKEKNGGFSNMCAGFPIVVNDVFFRSSEALYQALKFPREPEIQQAIADEKSPMKAKFIARARMKTSHCYDDSWWIPHQAEIMWYCVQLKLLFHWNSFGELFESNHERVIVELSNKNAYWGAKPQKDNKQVLVGQNVLGQVLEALRKLYLREARNPNIAVHPTGILKILKINGCGLPTLSLAHAIELKARHGIES